VDKKVDQVMETSEMAEELVLTAYQGVEGMNINMP
jgi:hypothetical protein